MLLLNYDSITLGILYAVISLANLIGDTWAYYITFGIVEMALTLLIVWYTWKWPKHSGSAKIDINEIK